MNPSSAALAAAVTFVWLGMVLSISFLEAPLKFRAPGVTLPIGVGIGRLVFRALNLVEAALAATLAVAISVSGPSSSVAALTMASTALLAVQLVAIRPLLTRRSDRILAGEQAPRSRAHLLYVVTECLKVAALTALGASVLAG